MAFSADQSRQIEEALNNHTIDFNLRLNGIREQWWWPDKQLISVSDEMLLAIIVPVWQRDTFEMWEIIDWSRELTHSTWDERFLNFNEEDIRPYAVRAGMLLEETTEYRERATEQATSPSHIQTGSELADYVGAILTHQDRS